MRYRIRDHVAWLFRPQRFLFRQDPRSSLRVPGWETACFVDRPEQVRAVNRATGDVFLGGAGNAFLEPLLGPQSVFLLDHDRHRLARRIMSPTLSTKALATWLPVIDGIIDEAITEALGRKRVNLGEWNRRIAMRVICQVALGVSEPRQVRRIFARFEATTGYLANLVSYVKRFWIPRGPLSVGAAVAYLVRRVDAELYPIIAARKSQQPAGEHTVDALIAGQLRHGYDDAFIRDNLAAVLAAGYDTTGSSLTWLCYWLARQPDVLPALRRARRTGHQHCLEAFRNEVLRYCPPVEILPRRIDPERLDEASNLVEGLSDVMDRSGTVPMVCPFVHRVHHDPQVHPEPGKFDPERFLNGRRYAPEEFLPFGGGRRMCLGVNLGKLVLDRLLARVLERGVTFRMSSRFAPVRRNVSIWPAFSVRARVSASMEGE